MKTMTETTEAVEFMPIPAILLDSFCDADFHTRIQGMGLAMREIAPLSLFVQVVQDSPMESARLPDGV